MSNGLLDVVIDKVSEILRPLWQPLPKEVYLKAMADIKSIGSALAKNQIVDMSSLHFEKDRRLSLLSAQSRLDLSSQRVSSGQPIVVQGAQKSVWELQMIRVQPNPVVANVAPLVLLFRGLCGLSSTGQKAFRSTTGPFSSLFVRAEDMYRGEWSHMSALAVILHAYRCSIADPPVSAMAVTHLAQLDEARSRHSSSHARTFDWRGFLWSRRRIIHQRIVSSLIPIRVVIG